jgi:hypothetical protein
MQSNKEYFNDYYYFNLIENGNDLTLYYSVADTLSESEKGEKKLDLKQSSKGKIKSLISKLLKSNKKVSTKSIEKKFKEVDAEGEIDELVDSDGTMLGSNIPILNLRLSPRKTTDQTIPMSRVSNDPVTRGYRVYWGESEDKQDNIVSEIDYSDAFGYEETENKDFKDTVNTLKDMGVENAIERAKQFGKLPKQKRKGGKLKQRLVEKEKLEESQRQEMIKMVEDILTKKSKKDGDVVKKVEDTQKSISQFLLKNLKSIRRLAEKENISIEQLIKALKYDE